MLLWTTLYWQYIDRPSKTLHRIINTNRTKCSYKIMIFDGFSRFWRPGVDFKPASAGIFIHIYIVYSVDFMSKNEILDGGGLSPRGGGGGWIKKVQMFLDEISAFTRSIWPILEHITAYECTNWLQPSFRDFFFSPPERALVIFFADFRSNILNKIMVFWWFFEILRTFPSSTVDFEGNFVI